MINKDLEPYGNRDFKREDAYLRAEKRLKELKGFYWHAFWYIAVNVFLIAMIVYNGGSILDFGTWATPLFWGIGLGFHAIGVFGRRFAFGKKWEERKVREFMEREERNQNQYE